MDACTSWSSSVSCSSTLWHHSQAKIFYPGVTPWCPTLWYHTQTNVYINRGNLGVMPWKLGLSHHSQTKLCCDYGNEAWLNPSTNLSVTAWLQGLWHHLQIRLCHLGNLGVNQSQTRYYYGNLVTVKMTCASITHIVHNVSFFWRPPCCTYLILYN